MIPLQLYIATFASNLEEGYNYFLSIMGESIGYGSSESDWTSDQKTELGRRVQDAYRHVNYPDVLPGDTVPHVWSHNELITTLNTASGDFDYTLPSSVGSVLGQFTYDADVSFSPIHKMSEQQLRNLRSGSTVTGHPTYYAIRWKHQSTAATQRLEVLFYPEPDAVYELTYRYALLVPPISKSNPFPVGGPRQTQLMIEACKATGQSVRDGQRGDQWAIFQEELASAIQLDKRTNFDPTVGRMSGPSSGLHGSAYPVRNEASYYFGPGGVTSDGTVVPDGEFVLES